jgi:cob(I)alamin adenosyltransferase
MSRRLTRIVTRTGDTGDTHLADGTTRRKSHARVAAIGDVDELNAQLGVLLALIGDDPVATRLRPIQHRLFDLGGALSLPEHAQFPETAIDDLERDTEALNATLPELENFILPGGNLPAAHAHVARTTCRRAERSLVALADTEPGIDDPALEVYLNRLSDLLFIAGRHLARRDGDAEPQWEQHR